MEAIQVPQGRLIYLLECYAPAGYRPEVESALRAACSHTGGLRGEREIEYVGAVLMPGDDLVFYAVRARDLDSVQQIANQAHLVSERIVESTLVGMEWTPDATVTTEPR